MLLLLLFMVIIFHIKTSSANIQEVIVENFTETSSSGKLEDDKGNENTAESVWLTWSNWTPCSFNCYGWYKYRFRSCKTFLNSTNCTNNSVQNRTCDAMHCLAGTWIPLPAFQLGVIVTTCAFVWALLSIIGCCCVCCCRNQKNERSSNWPVLDKNLRLKIKSRRGQASNDILQTPDYRAPQISETCFAEMKQTGRRKDIH